MRPLPHQTPLVRHTYDFLLSVPSLDRSDPQISSVPKLNKIRTIHLRLNVDGP